MGMTVVAGADSAFPQPPSGQLWWGVYVADHRTTPNVWTQADVKALDTSGVKRALPICVAPLPWPWALGLEGELTLLLGEAQAWGVPAGVPLVLDLEQTTLNNGALAWAPIILSTWADLLHGKYEAWVYSGVDAGDESTMDVHCWLAQWLLPDGQGPTTPPNTVPDNYSAWQYAGGVDNKDLDVMNEDAFARLMLTADLSAPPPPDPPPPPKEEEMAFIVTGSKGGKHLIDGAWRLPLTTPSLYDKYVAAGIKEQTGWTDAEIEKVPVAAEKRPII